MDPKQFYQTNLEGAVPLFLLRKSEWEKKIKKLTAKESKLFERARFQGKLGDFCLIDNQEGLLTQAYVGAGEDNLSLALAYAAEKLPQGSYALQQEIEPAALLSWALAQYRFDEYKKQELHPRILVLGKENLTSVLAKSTAIFFVRDLINKPTNDLGPEELATVVEKLAKEFHGEFKQWVGDELLVENFNAIHVVGRAAAKAPRLLRLNWGAKSNPKVSLIGKGVCFDSGGLDIKPADGMRLMKKDMGGAAHVLGLAQWIMKQNLAIRLEVLIPAVENAVGPESFRPGDILKMYNGLTVEVANTDAEGRLILADALALASEEKPELLIDIATLTGAARVAVGTEIAAMFTNDEALAQELNSAANAVEDPLWRLPLFKGYEAHLESSVADLTNLHASPYAGAITAALFLQRFIPKTQPWVHFDIMAWNLSSKPGKPEGGEAMALRALMHFLEKRYGYLMRL